MGIQGDLRACLRQLHQLPVSTLDYLPLWLETLRTLLSADAVAALWHDGDTQRSAAGNWFAPQSPVSACERFAASGGGGGGGASGDDAWFPMSPGGLIRGHARRISASHRMLDTAGECSPTLTRAPELDACLGDGDVLDICLMPVLRDRAGQRGAVEAVEGVDAVDVAHPADLLQRTGPLRILVSRDKTHRRFSAYEVQTFERAAAEFAIAPARPVLPWPEAGAAVFPVSAFGRDAGDDPIDPLCRDICGTLVWHHGQPEWADAAALGLMQRVWRGASGEVWPDACLVVRECHALAAELTSLPEAVTPSMSPEFLVPPMSPASAARHASRQVALPGGTLHLQATRLRSMSGRPTERVRIALHLAVPPAIQLLHRLWATPLTPVQREIAMRLLSGQSRAQAREACGIGVQTLKTHLSAMRARLDPVRDASLLRGLGGPGCGVSNASVRSGKTAARLE